MPDREHSPVALLSTYKKVSSNQDYGDKLLLVDIKKLEEKSANWAGVHLSVEASMSSVDMCLHQVKMIEVLNRQIVLHKYYLSHKKFV